MISLCMCIISASHVVAYLSEIPNVFLMVVSREPARARQRAERSFGPCVRLSWRLAAVVCPVRLKAHGFGVHPVVGVRAACVG